MSVFAAAASRFLKPTALTGQTAVHFKHLTQRSLSKAFCSGEIQPDGQTETHLPHLTHLSDKRILNGLIFAHTPKIVPTGQTEVQKTRFFQTARNIIRAKIIPPAM